MAQQYWVPDWDSILDSLHCIRSRRSFSRPLACLADSYSPLEWEHSEVLQFRGLDTLYGLPLDAELVHELVEGGAADAEFRGGGSNLAVVLLQGELDHFAFQILAGFLERLAEHGSARRA